MRQSDKWLLAELHIHVGNLTMEGRNAITQWLLDTADIIGKKDCKNDYNWNQPERKYRLKVAR